MPTLDEIKELCDKCTWKWTTYKGIKGYLVTGPNGNSIFLPATGIRWDEYLLDEGSYGYYWSGTLSSSSKGSIACGLGFRPSRGYWDNYGRECGHLVRPVAE